MTASQYKNIVQWTLWQNNFPADTPSLTVARKLFKNLGISFPQGNSTEQILPILNTNSFLGWRHNFWEDAQKYADIGIVSIGIDNQNIIILLPSQEIPILTNISDVISVKHPCVKHTDDLSDEEYNMDFFSYRYQFELDETE